MSDYLTHLTNRITQGGDVQPRPKSRFESFQPADDTNEESVNQEGATKPDQRIVPMLPQLAEPPTVETAVSPQSNQNEPNTPSTINQVVNHIHNSPPAVVNESSTIEQTYFINARPTQPALTEQLSQSNPIQQETIVEKTTPHQSIVAHHHYPAERLLERPLTPTSSNEDGAPPEPITPQSIIKKETHVENENKTIVEKHVVNTIRPNRPVQQIVMPTAPHSSSRRGRETAVASSEPVINVTIGRIEVKANMPPAAAPTAKTSKKAPIMTLDEYLKRGRGGGA